jgi:thiamine biosynthesis protein ThiS
VQIRLNGSPRECPEGSSVAELLNALGVKPEQVAIERNDALVPRARRAEVRLEEGDRVEVVTLVGGG